MSSTNIAKPDSAAHWYIVNDDGVKSYHEVPYAGARGKKGEKRSTTLRDARKIGAFPSVTSVLKVLHKDFLEAYKINQAILACLTLPRNPNETDDDFAKRAMEDSRQHAIDAAKLGGLCHELLAEKLKSPNSATSKAMAVAGEEVNDRYVGEVCTPTIGLLTEIIPDNIPTDQDFSEFHISHPLGFAGMCDGLMFIDTTHPVMIKKLLDAGYGDHPKVIAGEPLIVVVDIKTRGANTKKPLIYETDVLQLSAYLNSIKHTPNLGFNLTSENTPVCNLLVNTNEKAGKDGVWDTEIVFHKKEDVDKAWDVFKKLHSVWCWTKNYYPSETNGTD